MSFRNLIGTEKLRTVCFFYQDVPNSHIFLNKKEQKVTKSNIEFPTSVCEKGPLVQKEVKYLSTADAATSHPRCFSIRWRRRWLRLYWCR
jgi:hypothetical protein